MFLYHVLLTISFFRNMNEKVEYGRFSPISCILVRKNKFYEGERK